MTKFKKTITLLQNSANFILLSALLLACTMENYETGDSDFSRVMADLVEMQVNKDSKEVNYITSDADEQYALDHVFTADWITKPDTTYRALIYYNKVSDTKVQLKSAQQVTVVRPIEFNDEATIKTDPVELTSIWQGRNHKFVNVRLSLKTGLIDEGQKGHEFAIIKGQQTKSDDGKTTRHLTLFHERHDVPEHYSENVIFSILCADAEADSIKVYINTPKGFFTRTFPTE